MIHIIPRSKRKVHHEVAAVRSTASLPSTAQFGRSALPFSLTQDESETVPFCPILSNCVSNLYLLASPLNSLIHLEILKKAGSLLTLPHTPIAAVTAI